MARPYQSPGTGLAQHLSPYVPTLRRHAINPLNHGCSAHLQALGKSPAQSNTTALMLHIQASSAHASEIMMAVKVVLTQKKKKSYARLVE